MTTSPTTVVLLCSCVFRFVAYSYHGTVCGTGTYECMYGMAYVCMFVCTRTYTCTWTRVPWYSGGTLHGTWDGCRRSACLRSASIAQDIPVHRLDILRRCSSECRVRRQGQCRGGAAAGRREGSQWAARRPSTAVTGSSRVAAQREVLARWLCSYCCCHWVQIIAATASATAAAAAAAVAASPCASSYSSSV